MNKTLSSLVIAFLLLSNTLSISSLHAINLINSRDSLKSLLQSTPQTDGQRRLELLNHLCDIDFSLGDTTYIKSCWWTAVAQQDVNTLDDLLMPIAMKFQRKGLTDSVAVWMDYNARYVGGARGECNVQYMQLMSDISNWKELDKLSERILQEQVHIDPKRAPYQAMRVLYTLGVIVSFEKANNKASSLKTGREYMEEALAIARQQPFRESLRFRRQILLGLGSENLNYAQEYLQFAERFFAEPDMCNRPFYSRRTLISAYDKLITNGQQLPRHELDVYYRKLNQLIVQYPNDVIGNPAYFRARMEFRYNMAINNNEEALRWCDSLIAYSPKNNMASCYYIGDKMRLLGKLKRWEEGYQTAAQYFHIKDSLTNASNETKMTELQTQYEVDKLHQESILYKNRLLFSIAMVVLLLLLLIVYIVYSQRLKRRNRILYQHIRQQENSERQVTELRQALPKNQLTKEEELFQDIQSKLWQTLAFTNTDFNRDALVTMVGSNRTYVANAIRMYTPNGLSIMEYVNEQRLKYACSLLEANGNLSIESIAIDSGFSSSRTFFRQFKMKYELTPNEYRKASH